ncbi:MAG: 4-carboxymuconolactone decarboxylase [Marmoricola sp.]
MNTPAPGLVVGVELGGDPGLPLLVVGPSLGTSAETLWGSTAQLLADDFHVVGWDLPGHGHNQDAAEGFGVADLAGAVLALVERTRPGATRFCYAGDSIGGAVGQQLLLDAPDRVRAAALLCTAPRFGEPQGWRDRADLVRRSGTPTMVEGSAQRWFPEGFLDSHADVGNPLLQALRDTDRTGYAACCEALAGFDVRARLGEIDGPVLVVSGKDDVAAPPGDGGLIAEGVVDGRLVELDGVGHLAPAQAPDTVAWLLRHHFGASTTSPGMAVRRQVLGDAHVDRAGARTTDFTSDFQDLITRYAWGEIWARPGLDRRSRSMITLTAMIARGHHEELALHVRAALRNGLTREEIGEVILQSAIYCGVPDANTAFRIAQSTLEETNEQEGQ